MESVVSTLGYIGNDLHYVDQDRFSFITGSSLTIYDAHGPSEVITRPAGINAFTRHIPSGHLAFAPVSVSSPIEIISLDTREIIFSLDNPTSAEIVCMDFSRNGHKLYAITGVLDPKLIVWDLSDGEKVSAICDLSLNYMGLSINPGDDCLASLYGDEGTTIAILREISGEYSFHLENVSVTPDYGGDTEIQRSEEEKLVATNLANAATSVTWFPFDYLMIGNRQGLIVEVLVTETRKVKVLRKSSIKKLGALTVASVYVTSAIIVGDLFVMCTSTGSIYWFQMASFQSAPGPDTQIIDFTYPLQVANANMRLTTVVCDLLSERLLLGTSKGKIISVPSTVQDQDFGNEEDEMNEKRLEAPGHVTVDPITAFAFQGEAILACKPIVLPADSKTTLPAFILGSLDGTISLWSQPLVDANYYSNLESSGRAPLTTSTKLGSTSIGFDSSKDVTSVISLEVLPFKAKSNILLFAVGTDAGWLEIWEITVTPNKDKDSHIPVKLEFSRVGLRKFYNSPVNLLASTFFQAKQGSAYVVAVGSSADNTLHVVEVHNTAEGIACEVRNIYNIDDEPRNCFWYGDTLVVCDSTSKMNQFSAANAQLMTNKISYPISVSNWDMNVEDVIGSVLLGGGNDCSVIAYGTAEASFNSVDMASLEDVATSLIHDNVIVSMCASCDGKHIAAGCLDGGVYVWLRKGMNQFQLVKRFNAHSDAVLCLCFSTDSSTVLSCGSDGSIGILGVHPGNRDIKSDTKVMKAVKDDVADKDFHNKTPNPASLTWLQEKEANILERSKFENKENIKVIMSSLQEISAKHQKLLEENEKLTDLEKLDQADFVVDIAGRDRLISENEEGALGVHNAYTKANLWNELVASRIKQAFWDSMEMPSRPLLPIASDAKRIIITAFGVRKVMEEELISLEKIKTIRGIEVRSMQANGGVVCTLPNGKKRVTWSKSVAGFPETTSWIALEGARWPCEDIVDMLEERKRRELEGDVKEVPEDGEEEDNLNIEDDEEEEDVDAKRDFDESDVFNLLYPPQAVRTIVQKKTQIALLQEIQRIIRSKFNDHFEKLVSEKDDVLTGLESRNARMRIILKELKKEEESGDIVDYTWNNEEIKGSTITVIEKEINARPYESEKERLVRLAEEEERRKKDAEKDADNTFGRALEDMMNGVLSVKKDVLSDEAMVKPAWMDELDPKDMTELQLKELEEWDEKVVKHEEEQALYRKSLETEYKKLKQEAVDAVDAFDTKMAEMAKIKAASQKELLSQELYISQLSLSMSRRDGWWNSLKKTEELLESKRGDRNLLKSKIDAFGVQVDTVKDKMQAAQEEEKTMDKGFNRNLQDLTGHTYDIDSLKVFKALFRIRKYPKSEELLEASMDGSQVGSKTALGDNGEVVGEASVGGEVSLALNANDPFYTSIKAKEQKRLTDLAQIPILMSLDKDSDIPDAFSCDEITWESLQQLHLARVEKEIEAKTFALEYNKLREVLDQLNGEDKQLRVSINELKSSREETRGYLSEIDNDITIVACLRQGNDEVDKNAVVTDYTDSLLLPADVVHKFNARVKEHGKEKIGVLSRIKQFRRKINIIDWNAQHLTLQAHHFEEYFTDLQLLRVTRSLQSVIREGADESQAKARIDRIVQRKAFMKKTADEKIGKLSKFNEGMKRNLEDKSEELAKLATDIDDLEVDVSHRMNVKKSRDDARGATGDAVATAAMKMKKVVARRQLVDTARAQAEEIDYLRLELDKMRQRTFPSFSRVKKKY
jgi:WD40 repeat protein